MQSPSMHHRIQLAVGDMTMSGWMPTLSLTPLPPTFSFNATLGCCDFCALWCNGLRYSVAQRSIFWANGATENLVLVTLWFRRRSEIPTSHILGCSNVWWKRLPLPGDVYFAHVGYTLTLFNISLHMHWLTIYRTVPRLTAVHFSTSCKCRVERKSWIR